MCDPSSRIYIADMCRELRKMAASTRRPLLVYLLSLVIAEAERP